MWTAVFNRDSEHTSTVRTLQSVYANTFLIRSLEKKMVRSWQQKEELLTASHNKEDKGGTSSALVPKEFRRSIHLRIFFNFLTASKRCPCGFNNIVGFAQIRVRGQRQKGENERLKCNQ